MLGHKIAGAVATSHGSKFTKISKTSQHNNSEAVTNEHDKEVPKYIYIYISPEERQKVIDGMRLI